MQKIRFIICLLLLTGCSEIATVRHVTPRPPAVSGSVDQELVQAETFLAEGKTFQLSEPTRALGGYLACARLTADRLKRQPGDIQARQLYNFSVARCVEVVETAPLDPWNHPLSATGPDGTYILTSVRRPGTDRDPARYNIVPADTLVLGGTYLERRVTVDGVGAPVVAVSNDEIRNFRETLSARSVYGTATALIEFNDRRARIQFFEPFATERTTFANKSFPLAADFTAPIAVALTTERPEKLGLRRMLNPGKFADTARLTRLQAYDPKRIPVIFVHGLQDTPASWTPMINALRDDPDIRRRYQFWVYSYPSGYPYPYSAALFRQELDAVARAFPDRKGIVLVGHSMGGMISRLMITDVGDKMWLDFFGRPPSQTNLPPESKQLLEKALIFNHRPEVRRVIFMSAPHRGAEMASNWIGRIATKLIRTPFFLVSIPFRTIDAMLIPKEGATTPLNRIPNSIDTLSPKNRFVEEINKFPTTPGIPFHTIEGDRGRGDAPNSSDGVVAYWSSHMKGAQSELVVPSNHSSPINPEAIAEVHRILKLHHE